jgi:hypothetical protein
MGYTVVFYEQAGHYLREAFKSRETALKWVRLIRQNGYELHSIIREPIAEGARV